MNFSEIKSKMQSNFKQMTQDGSHLFKTTLDKDALWDLYLDSFPEGTNEIYRVRREHDCSCCRQFIKAVGNVVSIKDNIVTTIWGFNVEDKDFQVVANILDSFVKHHAVSDKFIGTDKNREQLENSQVKTWEHFYIELDDRFVDKTDRTIGDLLGAYRDLRNVFKRGLDEITQESIEIVLELIAQNSLYKGQEWDSQLKEFLKHKKAYSKLPANEAENYAWEQSSKINPVIGKLRNTSIGTLLTDLSEGADLEKAVKSFEIIVAPTNYKRPKAIFTKKMLEDAEKAITELGFMTALGRRHATINDITINNILFSNRDSAKSLGNVFAEMSKDIALNPKQFGRIEEITIESFIKNILPLSTELEVLVENRHSKNMVSLIAPKEKDSNVMFKWDNPFSWSYSGDITDSNIKENVKSAGGKVDGALRFSIQWNDGEHNASDYDAHCIEPGGNHINFGSKQNTRTTGNLDIDIMSPKLNVAAVVLMQR